MKKNWMEAFGDGVIASIITSMVLEMKIPQGDSLEALRYFHQSRLRRYKPAYLPPFMGRSSTR